ncbi:hypothetical protein C8035_v005835 [Colletotrichum spinosum]|uniref:Uncharacterized protein n=1 Tax=Colletotrichum spinosum TaxID=1347390 RepID=A0A4R8QQ51_9PEZI|nr:hypothetical protein C8035_v005835 [Colletotrichum spinosum]
MSVPPEDMIGYAKELDAPRASSTSSRPASMESQTKLAHLKLVSKYYGCANFSYPRPDGPLTNNPYRRAAHTYSSEDLAEDLDQKLSCPRTPTRRDRSSIASQSSEGSVPSLIDDRTDSEVSTDDDYQYHASASQLWDTFWPDGDETSHHTPEKSKTTYPALIPSPHIRRAKKTSCINYDDNPLPPRPVEYNIQINHSPSLTPAPGHPVKKGTMSQVQPQRIVRDSKISNICEESPDRPEPRRTIRAVRSSYSLFPRTQPQAPNYPPPPPPRMSNLSPSGLTGMRKGSRPPPIHLHSLPTPAAAPLHSPATASLYSPLYSPLHSPVPSPYTRPHTSHGTYHASMTDLTHPRSAPLPPSTPFMDNNNNNNTPRNRPAGADTPKSFFNFDSDSESEEPEPEHNTISRLVKKVHKRTASEARRSTKGAAFAEAQLRRARAAENEVEEKEAFSERRGRGGGGAAVFGRMFGRASGRS